MTKNASAAGTIDIGGDLTVNRMGFGAMRITGKGIWDRRRTGTGQRRPYARQLSWA